jgi:hypothetical protein
MNNRDWYKSFAKSMINDTRRIGCFSIACSTLAAALIASLCVKEDESASSPPPPQAVVLVCLRVVNQRREKQLIKHCAALCWKRTMHND